MNKKFIFLPLMISLFLSLASNAQTITPACKPSIVDYSFLITCVSGEQGSALFYNIQIDKVVSPFLCNNIISNQQADVVVTTEQGDVVDRYLLQQYQFAYQNQTSGILFHSYNKKLFLSQCLSNQGGGQGGFTIGN